MIRLLITLIIACIGAVSCDAELKVKKLAVTAFELYGEGEKHMAAKMFDKMARKYPESNYTSKNIFNAAIIYDEIDSNDIALDRYQEILNLELDDQEKDSSRDIGETRANYKHIACRNMGNIWLERNEFRTAINYFSKCLHKHPYYSDSAASRKKHSVELDRLRAKAYEGMGLVDSALVLTLQHAFTKSPYNSHPSKIRALRLINDHYDPQVIQEEFEVSFERLMLTHNIAILPWRDYKIHLIPYEQIVDEITPASLKQTSLYIDLYRYNSNSE